MVETRVRDKGRRRKTAMLVSLVQQIMINQQAEHYVTVFNLTYQKNMIIKVSEVCM